MRRIERCLRVNKSRLSMLLSNGAPRWTRTDPTPACRMSSLIFSRSSGVFQWRCVSLTPLYTSRLCAPVADACITIRQTPTEELTKDAALTKNSCLNATLIRKPVSPRVMISPLGEQTTSVHCSWKMDERAGGRNLDRLAGAFQPEHSRRASRERGHHLA